MKYMALNNETFRDLLEKYTFSGCDFEKKVYLTLLSNLQPYLVQKNVT